MAGTEERASLTPRVAHVPTTSNVALTGVAFPGYPQRTWLIDTPGGQHGILVELKTAGIWTHPYHPRGHVRILLDGTEVARVPPPHGQHRLVEVPLAVDDIATVVLLEWHPDWDSYVRVDVFRDGLSMLDGGSLEASRAAVPPPLTGYNMGLSIHEREKHSSIDVALTAIAIGGAGVLCQGTPFGQSLLILAITAVWMAAIVAIVHRVNRWNLAHEERGDIRWLFLVAAAIGPFVALPVALMLLAELRHALGL